MYDSLQEMEREGKAIGALSGKDFTTIIIKPLENAEKILYFVISPFFSNHAKLHFPLPYVFSISPGSGS
jgi:hypothetical protein